MGITVRIKDLEEKIDAACVASQLPPAVLRLVLKEKLNAMVQIEAQAYMHEMNETKEETVEPPAVTEELQEVQDAGE